MPDEPPIARWHPLAVTLERAEIFLQPAASLALLGRVESELFPRHGLIAFESDVRVLRSGKC